MFFKIIQMRKLWNHAMFIKMLWNHLLICMSKTNTCTSLKKVNQSAVKSECLQTLMSCCTWLIEREHSPNKDVSNLKNRNLCKFQCKYKHNGKIMKGKHTDRQRTTLKYLDEKIWSKMPSKQKMHSKTNEKQLGRNRSQWDLHKEKPYESQH